MEGEELSNLLLGSPSLLGRADLHFWETASQLNDDASAHEKQHLHEILQRLKRQ